jgi:hypothetical protein
MATQEVIALSREFLRQIVGHDFAVLEVSKPVSPDAALNLAKIISKLSPLVGNLIEFNTCEYLNDKPEFVGFGKWKRQDPGFPDTIFEGTVVPVPGFEIKAWLPLATEITARFKDSQSLQYQFPRDDYSRVEPAAVEWERRPHSARACGTIRNPRHRPTSRRVIFRKASFAGPRSAKGRVENR